MALLVRLLLLLFICAPALRPAYGTERGGDAPVLYALNGEAEIVSALESDILALIEQSPDEDRFDLYRTYNQLMGTWVQVDLSRAMLELSISATLPLEEEEIRTHLRDHARFALWDLDEARMSLEWKTPDADRQEHRRICAAIRALLSEAEITIGRLLVDQCGHGQCVAAPDPALNPARPRRGPCSSKARYTAGGIASGNEKPSTNE